MYANSEGSGEPAILPLFVGRLRDKYHNVMSWLIYRSQQLSLYPVAALKGFRIHRHYVVSFSFSVPLGL